MSVLRVDRGLLLETSQVLVVVICCCLLLLLMLLFVCCCLLFFRQKALSIHSCNTHHVYEIFRCLLFFFSNACFVVLNLLYFN